jgi:hypothetical protein
MGTLCHHLLRGTIFLHVSIFIQGGTQAFILYSLLVIA